MGGSVRHVLVEGGVVTNTIMLAPGVPWTPPVGCEVVASDTAQVGWQLQPDGRLVPPHLHTLDAAQAWATQAIEEHAAAQTTVTIDGVAYGVAGDSQANWSSLFEAARSASTLGLPGPWPVAFVAAPGVVVELDTEAEARALYLRVFAAGDEIRTRAMVFVGMVLAAVTAAEVDAIVDDYMEGS